MALQGVFFFDREKNYLHYEKKTHNYNSENIYRFLDILSGII